MPQKRPLFHRLIQHNYVGAGNAIDSAEAVDSIDAIAKEHDILYQAIEESGVNLESVNSADINSGSEFISEGLNQLTSGSVSSGLLGVASGVALNAKSALEKYVVGKPIYPNMAPQKRIHKKKPATPNPLDQTPGRVYRVSGFQKANLKRAKDKLEKMLKDPNTKAAEIEKQRKLIKATEDSYNQQAAAANYHKEAANHRALINELEDLQPVIDTPPSSRAEGTFDESESQPAKKMKGEDNLEEGIEELTELVPEEIPYENQLESNLEVDAVNQNDIEMLQSNEIYLHDLGLDDDMANVSQVIRSQGIKYEDGYIIAEYSRLFYSWGYNFTALDIADRSTPTIKQKWIMTPMAYVPVDYLPFYIPKSLYEDLPQESMIEEVGCKVTPWGSRVSFQTNADTTSPATAQHVVVGCSAIGLNKNPEFNWANRDVTESNTMVISTHTTPDDTKMTKKIWGAEKDVNQFNDVPSSFGAIRQLDVYGGPALDNYVAKTATVAEFVNSGWPAFETKYNRFAYDAHKGKPIVNYTYKPKFGVIKAKPRVLQCNRSDNAQIAYRIVGVEGNRVLNVDSVYRTASGANQTGQSATTTARITPASDHSFLKERQVYESPVDMAYARFRADLIGTPIEAQPQLHIGILPVQANQPGTSVGFVCAAAYWQIDSFIKIKVDFGSAFNTVVARPIDWMESYYSDAMDDNFGLHGSFAGNIPQNEPYA